MYKGGRGEEQRLKLVMQGVEAADVQYAKPCFYDTSPKHVTKVSRLARLASLGSLGGRVCDAYVWSAPREVGNSLG